MVGDRDGLPLDGVETIMTENPRNQEALSSELPFIDLRDRPSPDILRVLAIGSPQVVHFFVMTLFQYGYARPDEWSRPLPTINQGEVMQILTKRINLFE
ncbi:hypothetical protein [Leptodesmis sichuanensis]|uniref:hypothetical protein n=1 Tax=Leptodesmis sichuanensis TaxID=2906798 RepID=UPI001F16B034|nr:hypothetical protein [Leptodesmis sichuanensis]UIE36016.1 hypothetical protein KIK02_13040 [Leptodesmis sichuanensis A121]